MPRRRRERRTAKNGTGHGPSASLRPSAPHEKGHQHQLPLQHHRRPRDSIMTNPYSQEHYNITSVDSPPSNTTTSRNNNNANTAMTNQEDTDNDDTAEMLDDFVDQLYHSDEWSEETFDSGGVLLMDGGAPVVAGTTASQSAAGHCYEYKPKARLFLPPQIDQADTASQVALSSSSSNNHASALPVNNMTTDIATALTNQRQESYDEVTYCDDDDAEAEEEDMLVDEDEPDEFEEYEEFEEKVVEEEMIDDDQRSPQNANADGCHHIIDVTTEDRAEQQRFYPHQAVESPCILLSEDPDLESINCSVVPNQTQLEENLVILDCNTEGRPLRVSDDVKRYAVLDLEKNEVVVVDDLTDDEFFDDKKDEAAKEGNDKTLPRKRADHKTEIHNGNGGISAGNIGPRKMFLHDEETYVTFVEDPLYGNSTTADNEVLSRTASNHDSEHQQQKPFFEGVNQYTNEVIQVDRSPPDINSHEVIQVVDKDVSGTASHGAPLSSENKQDHMLANYEQNDAAQEMMGSSNGMHYINSMQDHAPYSDKNSAEAPLRADEDLHHALFIQKMFDKQHTSEHSRSMALGEHEKDILEPMAVCDMQERETETGGSNLGDTDQIYLVERETLPNHGLSIHPGQEQDQQQPNAFMVESHVIEEGFMMEDVTYDNGHRQQCKFSRSYSQDAVEEFKRNPLLENQSLLGGLMEESEVGGHHEHDNFFTNNCERNGDVKLPMNIAMCTPDSSIMESCIFSTHSSIVTDNQEEKEVVSVTASERLGEKSSVSSVSQEPVKPVQFTTEYSTAGKDITAADGICEAQTNDDESTGDQETSVHSEPMKRIGFGRSVSVDSCDLVMADQANRTSLYSTIENRQFCNFLGEPTKRTGFGRSLSTDAYDSVLMDRDATSDLKFWEEYRLHRIALDSDTVDEDEEKGNSKIMVSMPLHLRPNSVAQSDPIYVGEVRSMGGSVTPVSHLSEPDEETPNALTDSGRKGAFLESCIEAFGYFLDRQHAYGVTIPDEPIVVMDEHRSNLLRAGLEPPSMDVETAIVPWVSNPNGQGQMVVYREAFSRTPSSLLGGIFRDDNGLIQSTDSSEDTCSKSEDDDSLYTDPKKVAPAPRPKKPDTTDRLGTSLVVPLGIDDTEEAGNIEASVIAESLGMGGVEDILEDGSSKTEDKSRKSVTWNEFAQVKSDDPYLSGPLKLYDTDPNHRAGRRCLRRKSKLGKKRMCDFFYTAPLWTKILIYTSISLFCIAVGIIVAALLSSDTTSNSTGGNELWILTMPPTGAPSLEPTFHNYLDLTPPKEVIEDPKPTASPVMASKEAPIPTLAPAPIVDDVVAEDTPAPTPLTDFPSSDPTQGPSSIPSAAPSTMSPSSQPSSSPVAVANPSAVPPRTRPPFLWGM